MRQYPKRLGARSRFRFLSSAIAPARTFHAKRETTARPSIIQVNNLSPFRATRRRQVPAATLRRRNQTIQLSPDDLTQREDLVHR